MLWINCGKQNPSPHTHAHTKLLTHTNARKSRSLCFTFLCKEANPDYGARGVRGAFGKDGGRCCIFLTAKFIRFFIDAVGTLKFLLCKRSLLWKKKMCICVYLDIYTLYNYVYLNVNLQNVAHFAHKWQNCVISNSSAWCSNAERHTTPPRTFPSDLGSSCAAAWLQAWGPRD